MDQVFSAFFNWVLPPFLAYLVHPIFLGMVLPSRLKRWWQVAALSAALSLFNLPKAIWGAYSVQGDVVRVVSVVLLCVVIPLAFFEGTVWKRLLTNLLLYSGQFFGECMAVWALTSREDILARNSVSDTVGGVLLYTAVAVFCNILFDALLVILARSLQARRFSWVYLPTICIVLGLWGSFYAYLCEAKGWFLCLCTLLCGGSFLAFLYYIISLEEKTGLEAELRDTQHRMALEKNHYRAVEARQEELAKIRHDFNNQLAAIGALVQQGERQDAQAMLRRLSADIAATRENVYCAVPVVNAVLTEKETLCRASGVTLRTELALPEALGVEPLHLCSILSNLLDNAVHACAGLEQPVVTLASAMAGDYLLLRTVNPSPPPQRAKEGHGYGTKILRELSAKYDGSYETSYENGVFTAVVSLLPRD